MKRIYFSVSLLLFSIGTIFSMDPKNIQDLSATVLVRIDYVGQQAKQTSLLQSITPGLKLKLKHVVEAPKSSIATQCRLTQASESLMHCFAKAYLVGLNGKGNIQTNKNLDEYTALETRINSLAQCWNKKDCLDIDLAKKREDLIKKQNAAQQQLTKTDVAEDIQQLTKEAQLYSDQLKALSQKHATELQCLIEQVAQLKQLNPEQARNFVLGKKPTQITVAKTVGIMSYLTMLKFW